MLTATTAKNIASTARYFDEVLSQGDYYTGQEVASTWNGKAAKFLEIEIGSLVTPDAFKAMLAGKHPATGEKLTQRVRKDRRPGFDLTFSVPKSVSVAWAINGDEEIVNLLQEAVKETIVNDVEPLMCRRVRDGRKAQTQERTPTGKLIYCDFLHKTSRPVDGEADPHLHVHAFVFNYTSDGTKHYAAEPEEIFRRRKSLQAAFEARLARKLRDNLGYAVTRTTFSQSGRLKKGWEIEGIKRSTIEKFARRTAKIEAEAQARGITDPGEKGKLGAKIREKKDECIGIETLRDRWHERLTDEEKRAIAQSKAAPPKAQSEQEQLDSAIRFALEHHLYRQSTAEKHVIVGTALEHGVTLRPEQVEAALRRDGIIQKSHCIRGMERNFVTTREVLDAETRMIAFAREGRGRRMSIARGEHQFELTWLNEEQKAAVRHVLYSRDTVTAIKGGAGTGKSSLMQEAARGIHQNGKKLFVFAPSSGAREVLEEKGFSEAKTVEHLLRNDRLHAQLRDQVLWVDEAGLLDVRSMNGVFDVAKAQNCRVILSGDTKQHSSPRRGEAMRLLENEAGLDIARVQEVQRQKGRYKRAVELVSLGDTIVDAKSGMTGMIAGFDLLDQLGRVKEIAGDDRHEILAKSYLASAAKQKSTLVIAPTHKEGRAVTEHIREELRERGAIGKEEHLVSQLRSLNLTEAEKRELSSYTQSGLVLQFHQNVKGGFKRGARYRVHLGKENQPTLVALEGGDPKPLPSAYPDRFEVYKEERVGFSVGDKIRFSLGGTAMDGKRKIANGRLDRIQGFDEAGNLVLQSGMTISHGYGHFDLGYSITSHASQGKDSDIAIAAIGCTSLPAVNAKQFYVTLTRGKEDVEIYVDNKVAVRRAIQTSGDQRSATDLVGTAPNRKPETATARREQEHRTFLVRVRDWWQRHVRNQGLGAARTASAIPRNNYHRPRLGRS
ncbi:MAG: MobF family relaxase [Planctomycetota bacterium]